MQPYNLFAWMTSCHVFNLCCRQGYNFLSLTHRIDWSIGHLEHKSASRSSSIKISSPVDIERAMYIHFSVSFRFHLVIDHIFCYAMQIHEYSLENNPMILPRCQHVPTQYSHCMRNIWSSTNHCIHCTNNNISIGNMCHVLKFFFLCLWTLFKN